MYETQDQTGHRPPFAGSGAQRYGKPIDPRRLIRAMARRKWWIIVAIAVGGVLGALVAKFVIPRVYAASSQIVWEPKDRAPEARELRTHVDSIKVQTNLTEIRRRTGVHATLFQLSQKLDVQYDADSNLVTIYSTGDSPEEAAGLANTTVEVFMSQQRDLASARAKEHLHQVQQDKIAAETARDAARAEYDKFRQEHGIVDITTETQNMIEEAATLRAQAQIREERRTVRANGSAAISERLRQKQSELAEARVSLTDEHPKVQRLLAEIRTLQNQAAQAATASADTPPRPMAADAGAGPRPIQAVEDRLARLSAVEGEASVLLSDVRVAEAHVNELNTEVAHAEDDVRSARADFRIVSPALPDQTPVKSFRRPIAIASPVLSGLLAIILILILELRGFRVFTAEEISFWGRGPVVGTSTWPSGPHTLKALVEELGDVAPKAGGVTLVVPTSKEDELLSEAIAGRLQLYTHAIAGPAPSASGRPQDPHVVDVRTQSSRPVVRETLDATIVDPQQPMVTPPPGAGANYTPPYSPGRPGHGSALAVSPPVPYPARPQTGGMALEAQFLPWKGALDGPQLRGAARQVDRVLVVIPAGKLSAPDLAAFRTQIGRDDGVGYVVVGMPEHLAHLADRSGPFEIFWLSQRV